VTNPSKIKGTRFETRVATFLGPWFPEVERRAQAGNLDRGDLRGVPNWAVEAKDRKVMNLSGWCSEAAVEAVNSGCRYWVVVHNYPRHPTPQIHCTMPLWVLAELATGRQLEAPPLDTPDDGKLFADAVWHFLEPYGYDPIRGSLDRWQLTLEPSINLTLGPWSAAAAKRAGESPWGVVHRKRQAPIGDTYVTTSLLVWAQEVAASMPDAANVTVGASIAQS
jgi:hypothetical protein